MRSAIAISGCFISLSINPDLWGLSGLVGIFLIIIGFIILDKRDEK